ncbi:MAG: response regulator transcription factor [Planctomycetes bacterium]|nr:response regulator transcription factor [Planctomycetota bacterium]
MAKGAHPPSEDAKVRVLIVDDHPVVRQGLRILIQEEPDLVVCAEAETVAEALQAAGEHRPDVAVVDLSLKDASGLDLIKDLKVRHPEIASLVLSVSDENLYAERALRAGAKGYVMKEVATDGVIRAIRCVHAGGVFLSDDMKSRLLGRFVDGAPAEETSAIDRLSDRELEVFELIGRGQGTREIAAHLHLSPKTIETYRAHIKEKLNLANAAQLVQRAVRHVQETSGG